jgi:4'-phosphopantetheinyl transferase
LNPVAPGLALASLQTLRWPDPTLWLAPGERQRLATFTHPRRREISLASRWLARTLLAGVMGGGPDEVSVDIDAAGRSFLPSHPDWHLSISHSGDWVACVVAPSAVGLDIEQLRPRAQLVDIAATAFPPSVCEHLATLHGEARTLRFYQEWTLREAWLKRQGQGLDLARMRTLQHEEADDDSAQALSLFDESNGLVIAVDGAALRVSWPDPIKLVRRLRYLAAGAAGVAEGFEGGSG